MFQAVADQGGDGGAGGIGFALNEAILGLEWSRVGTILVVILAVVMLSEAPSAWVRRLT